MPETKKHNRKKTKNKKRYNSEIIVIIVENLCSELWTTNMCCWIHACSNLYAYV